MKKAKSQAVASSVEENKNRQQLIATHVNFSVSSPMIEDDPDEVFLEGSLSSNSFGRWVIVPGGGVTDNLSRKKAMPPQPGKKLAIKLVKGQPTLPANFEEITWATLKSAISAIFLKQPNPCDLEKLYQDFCDQVLMIRGEALYLDITYVKQIPKGRSLWDMGLQLCCKHLSLALEVEHKAVFGLLKMLDS